MKRTLNALFAIALTGALTACGDNDDPDPIPGAEPSTTSSNSPSEPTETADAWRDDYTPRQLRAYDAALQRFESYEQRSEPIWAKGKATPAARALFEEYFPSPYWQGLYRRLESYEQVEVKTEGTPEVYWSRPTQIAKDGLSVTIEQCVDYTAANTTQYGEEIETNNWATEPRLRTIHLSRPDGYDWLIYKLLDATSKPRPKPCTR